MNLRDLEYIIAIDQYRHFSKAAQAVHVSQPALSMQLRKLEAFLQVTLFERSYPIRPTAAGEAILISARAIMHQCDQIHAIADAAQNPFKGILRLGLFPTLSPYLLPLVMPKLKHALPDIRYILIEEKTPLLLEMLEDGRLDMVFLALPVAERFRALKLFDDEFYLAVSKEHKFAAHDEIDADSLADETLLLLEDGHCLRDQALDFCSHTGAHEADNFRATSLETLRQMVATGDNITLIPKIAIRDDDSGLHYLKLNPPPQREIGLVTRRQFPRQELTEKIFQLLTH